MTRFNAAWQMVTCRECKAHYKCTPMNDYYNATSADDGLCETCLVTGAGLDPAKTVTVVVDK